MHGAPAFCQHHPARVHYGRPDNDRGAHNSERVAGPRRPCSLNSRLGTSMSVTLLTLAFAALASAPAPGTPLTIMSYNVRYGTADDGPDAWEHRHTRLAELIRYHDPDVLGVQECLDFQADFIVTALPDRAWIGLGREADGTGEMTAIVYRKSRMLPLESGHFWLSETPGTPGSKSWDSSLPRIATWARFYDRANAREIVLYNTHLDHRGEAARRESARLLATHIGANHPGESVVVTGDFNADAGSSEPWRILAESGLRDTWEMAGEKSGEANTWNGFDTPDPGAARRIDWILTTSDIATRACTIDARSAGGRYPSDHMPVIARIELQTAN